MSSLEADSRRGYTDFLTGSTQLLDIPSNALLKYLIKGRLPPLFLPSFLHEATHFWCMSTDLGATLALLEMRAQHQIGLEQFDRNCLLHDLGTTKITQQLLGPLLEGMALFQEFDALPGDSRVVSPPAVWAAFLFQPLGEDPPQISDQAARAEWMTNRIRQTLFQYRTSEKALHRKLGVLMRSISNDPHYYLAGYLSVKQIWLTAASNTPAFRDRDLFLCFLRDWIFQDWKLIDYLANPDLHCGAVAHLASERIQTRLVQLATTNLAEEVAVYDEEMDAGRCDPARLLWSIHILEGESQQAQKRVGSILDEIGTGMNGGDHENWYIADMLTLSHRQEMMRLALEPVEIEVTEHDRVIVRKNTSIESTYLAGAAPAGAERGVTPGWMTAYFLPKLMAVVALAVRENQPMISVAPTEIPDNEWAALRYAVTTVVATESARREFTGVGREQIEGLEDLDYKTTLGGIPDHVRQVYTFYALSAVSEDRVAEVEAMLSRKGLYDILGKNGDLLTALVKISLVPPSSNASTRELLSKIIARDGIELDSVLPQLYQRQEETGMPLLVGKDDVIWYMV